MIRKKCPYFGIKIFCINEHCAIWDEDLQCCSRKNNIALNKAIKEIAEMLKKEIGWILKSQDKNDKANKKRQKDWMKRKNLLN